MTFSNFRSFPAVTALEDEHWNGAGDSGIGMRVGAERGAMGASQWRWQKLPF
jgi:hypothetical protein